MKKRKVLPMFRKVFPVMILIASLLMSVGYASVNSILIGFNGTAIAKLPSGVYITEANYNSNVDANLAESTILSAYQTNLNSKVVLSSTNPASSITYTINIINTTDKTQVFNGVEYLPENYSNNDITYLLNGLAINDELEPGQNVTFTITFYYRNNTLSSNNTLNSIINFDFSEKQSNTLKDMILAHNTVITTPPTLTTSSNNSPNEPSGLYVSTETNTTEPTYYFRGNVTNNNIKFAGLDWKIVRINEDGSVRLSLANSAGSTKMQHNSNGINYTYFTYDEYNIYRYTAVAKPAIDTWYTNNIENPGFGSYVVTGKFCAQAKVKNSDVYTGVTEPLTLYTDYTPNFECSTDANGHGEVQLKVGLITYDEMIFAGAYPLVANEEYYLYTGLTTWTMSSAGTKPSGTNWTDGSYWSIRFNGSLSITSASTGYTYYFPVINIDGSLPATGNGEPGSEYELILN